MAQQQGGRAFVLAAIAGEGGGVGEVGLAVVAEREPQRAALDGKADDVGPAAGGERGDRVEMGLGGGDDAIKILVRPDL